MMTTVVAVTTLVMIEAAEMWTHETTRSRRGGFTRDGVCTSSVTPSDRLPESV